MRYDEYDPAPRVRKRRRRRGGYRVLLMLLLLVFLTGCAAGYGVARLQSRDAVEQDDRKQEKAGAQKAHKQIAYSCHQGGSGILYHNQRTGGDSADLDENVGGGKSSGISDTTARKAMLLAEDELYQNLKRIVDGIDRLYETLDDDEKIIVDMRYRTKRGHNEWEDIAHELGYSRRKVLKIRDGIIDRTANEVKWA